MKLTDEQRGETQQEAKLAGGSTAVESSDDKKPTDEKDDVKNIQVCLDLQTSCFSFPFSFLIYFVYKDSMYAIINSYSSL